ncbi:hypothetical protein [Micromonospora humida]|uniref:hypothetical protein n=1 Tax=Micromonospora humida TaxID=2809018 RepID=UPI00341F04FF
MDDEVPAPLRHAAARAVDEATLVDALAALTAQPSPYGRERATAHRVADWAAGRWPELPWRVDPLERTATTPDSANLVGGSDLGDRPELLIYSHLDTSLTGGTDFDAPITGRVPMLRPASPGVRAVRQTVSGTGGSPATG